MPWNTLLLLIQAQKHSIRHRREGESIHQHLFVCFIQGRQKQRNRMASLRLLVRTTRSALHHHQHHRRLYSSERDTLSFGIAFDIDGVVLRGSTPIEAATRSFRRLYKDFSNPCEPDVPFVFLTNGGGVRESKRASELSDQLGVHVSPHQVLQGHTPFRKLADRFNNDLVLSVGKGEPSSILSDYGFRKVISIDEYTTHFQNIDPLAPYKHWSTKVQTAVENSTPVLQDQCDIESKKIHAAFILSDPVDWGRDIQVLCDVLRSGGLPGKLGGNQPPLFLASDDLEYQGAFPTERLGMGAFRIAVEAVYNRVHHSALEYKSFGKPNAVVFNDAETILQKLAVSLSLGIELKNLETEHFSNHRMKTLYMIGDNPAVDVLGACQAGPPWFSILTRTGCFKGDENHHQFPADLVVDTVEDAIEFILRRHSDELSYCLNAFCS